VAPRDHGLEHEADVRPRRRLNNWSGAKRRRKQRRR
jgi:hypothetical protein